MELYVAGGCSEHGRNSFLVSGEHLSFLVDAGVMKEHPERKWPDLTKQQIRNVSYVFLTHCHADHTGAIEWLYENGFQGTVIASEATIRNTKKKIRKSMALEELTGPCSECMIAGGLHLMWGRSGHCIGSVWYRFSLDGRSILFTGDYQEQSYAYPCDMIRGIQADAAVLDCAYGFEHEDAGIHREILEHDLTELAEKDIPLLFPVPSHGRGLDVVGMLAERSVPVVLDEDIIFEYRSYINREFWLSENLLKSLEKLIHIDISDFNSDLKRTESLNYPDKYLDAAILVRDSQLYDAEHRELADRVCLAGGKTILTGKQDPSSYARTLLNEGRAVFDRISVHQNVDELMRLVETNQFGVSIPYHCRQELSFRESCIRVMKAGETLKF